MKTCQRPGRSAARRSWRWLGCRGPVVEPTLGGNPGQLRGVPVMIVRMRSPIEDCPSSGVVAQSDRRDGRGPAP